MPIAAILDCEKAKNDKTKYGEHKTYSKDGKPFKEEDFIAILRDSIKKYYFDEATNTYDFGCIAQMVHKKFGERGNVLNFDLKRLTDFYRNGGDPAAELGDVLYKTIAERYAENYAAAATYERLSSRRPVNGAIKKTSEDQRREIEEKVREYQNAIKRGLTEKMFRIGLYSIPGVLELANGRKVIFGLNSPR